MIDTRTLQETQHGIDTGSLESKWDKFVGSVWTKVEWTIIPPPEPPKQALIDRYIERAMLRARAEWLPEDNSWFADIPAIQDVWADGPTPDASFDKLASVLRAWLEWKIEEGDDDIPPIDSIDLRIL